MSKHLRLWFLLGALASAACAESAGTPVHDPTMIKADGTYYLFGTGNGIAVKSSKDMKVWQDEPPVFEHPPAWTFSTVPGFRGHIWAPDISFHNGQYYLYYAISLGGKITSAIGVATNKTLDRTKSDFAWVDHGMVLQSVPGRDLWNAIDPQLVLDEEATPWLVFGSFWSGIKLVKLQTDMLRVAESQEWHSLAKRERSVLRPDTDPEPAAIEAPFIIKHGADYILFVSWDYCCRGVRSTYKIVIGRAKTLTGPYLDKDGHDLATGGGTILLEGNGDWPGVGHNSAYQFDGRDYLIFHAYDAHDQGKSKLKIVPMDFDSQGWPKLGEQPLAQ